MFRHDIFVHVHMLAGMGFILPLLHDGRRGASLGKPLTTRLESLESWVLALHHDVSSLRKISQDGIHPSTRGKTKICAPTAMLTPDDDDVVDANGSCPCMLRVEVLGGGMQACIRRPQRVS